ncbi:uncharacterized protein SAPINGB_P002716 [Magnusiomyces paraingens]|uniref:Peroxisomal membrane protein PMP22 n=1 Tax=Magnusiomyces paraingens TaxID=2606893 RepID=A0A5E8BFD8_9ASCO|nr:uncharacterized protein SAPINGB_P002716 [Saprochaete ingens]VVT50344.1 unnamed protein product [Saprochaete ingens]
MSKPDSENTIALAALPPPPPPPSQDTLLQQYLIELQTNPIRTKAITSATLNALSEILASYVAGEKDPKTGSYISARVPKMALYGFFVSAPLSHYLVNALQRAFKGKTGGAWKIAQIVASQLLVTPIQNSVFLIFMSVFAGARSLSQVYASWKQAFLTVQKSSWISSPLVMAFAQKFIPEHAWVPFFSLFAFFLVTYNNIIVKKKRQAQLKKDQDKSE